MPPKAKGKKNKLANMTDEERAIYFEQQRLAEEEMRLKKVAMLTQYLQDKLEREQKMAKHNDKKLTHHWRTLMRDAKTKELKRDIEILAQTFERIIDRKESIIKTLVKDLNESEEQYMMSLRSHIECIDEMIEMQNQRLQKLKQEYETELRYLNTEFGEEENFIIEQHSKQLDDLKDIFVALNSTYSSKESEARLEHHSMKDELKNRNLEDRHALRIALESKVNQLWTDYKTAIQQYSASTEERKIFYENLKTKDEKSAAEIEQQMRKLQRIADNISTAKRKSIRLSKEYDEKNRHLKEEREKLVAHFLKLKAQITRLREFQHEKITKLAIESTNASKAVKRLLTKAEHILQLMEHCRKYQTEEEKVIPFSMSTLTAEEEEKVRKAYQLEEDDEVSMLMRRCVPLETFWRRYNKVQLDQLILWKERDIQREENEKLKAVLKHYLDGLSVNDQVVVGESITRILQQNQLYRPTLFDVDDRVRNTRERSVEIHNAASPVYQFANR